jgi:hypothetical protein
MLRTLSLALLVLVATASPAAAQPTDDAPDAPDAEPGATGDGDAPAGEPPEADPAAVDVDDLRQQYLALRDRLFRSRARAAAVASAMYSTKLRVDLTYDTGRYYTIGRATIRLDGANVFDDIEGAIARDKAPRFEGYIAPGRHLVSIRIEAAGKDDDRFTSVMEDTFVVIAPAGKDLVISARARDAGDIPYQWERKQQGSYKLHLDVDVKAVDRPEAGGDAKGK